MRWQHKCARAQRALKISAQFCRSAVNATKPLYIGLLNNDAVVMPELVFLLRAALAERGQHIGMSGGRMHKLHYPQEVDSLGITLYASLMPADRKDTADPYLGPTGGCCLMSQGFVKDIVATTGYCFDERFFLV
jgi:GT2 family glycosyltransferase